MKILSLDIGSYSVKAVEFDVTFGRIELGDYLIERVIESDLASTPQTQTPPESGAPEEKPQVAPRQLLTTGQIAALRRILAERQFKYERLAVNFPKAWITTRIFNLPTKDRKAIQSSLAFELDDDIPFSMNDIIYDFAVLNNEGTGSTVFTAVALKSDITILISELQMLGLDPDSITIEAWGMSQLLKRSIPRDYEGRPVCILNLGHRNSTVHMMVGESPVLTHVSTCAGLDITRAIAQAYNLSFDQAEKSKIDGAFLLTQLHYTGQPGQPESANTEPLTKEQKAFGQVMADALIPLLREIKQTLMSYKANYKMSPRAIFITGGTSQIPNLQLFLEEQLQIPVFPLHYMSRVVGQTLQLSETNETQISTAAGLGLSQVKVDRNFNINLRKDEFAKRGGIGAFDFRAFRKPLKYVAASLAFVYLNLIAQGIVLSTRAAKQQEALDRAIKSVVGAVNPSVLATYKNSPSTLKSAVNKEITKYKTTQVATTKPQVNALDVLNKVSQSMPRDMTLDVSTFQVKEGKFKLAGLVNDINNPVRIAKALEETRVLESVTKEKAEEDPKSHKVRFEFSAKVAEGGNVKTR